MFDVYMAVAKEIVRQLDEAREASSRQNPVDEVGIIASAIRNYTENMRKN